LGNIREIQYYVPGFAAYGVMSACFNNLAISLVIRREVGLLKRMRLAPLPNWVMLADLPQRAAHRNDAGRALDARWAIGYTSCCRRATPRWSLLLSSAFVAHHARSGNEFGHPKPGIRWSNREHHLLRAPVLSGLWFPLQPGSALAKISSYFPVAPPHPCDIRPVSTPRAAPPLAWHDIVVMLIWGAIGIVISLRRFSWKPRRH